MNDTWQNLFKKTSVTQRYNIAASMKKMRFADAVPVTIKSRDAMKESFVMAEVDQKYLILLVYKQSCRNSD